MRDTRNGKIRLAFAIAVAVIAGPLIARGDEPGVLGRLFRFGSSGSRPTERAVERVVPREGGEARAMPALPSPTIPLVGSAPTQPVVAHEASGSSAHDAPAGTPSTPRLIPQPRRQRPVTDADPLVTRVVLGRSAEGSQFGMFLQVYADGVVIDSQGVHTVSRKALDALLAVLQEGEIQRLRGHCGNPPTDYVEQVQMVVFERGLGRLRAVSFSFSGNPQGCHASVRKLQAALEAIQLEISGTAAPATAVSPPSALPPPELPAPPVTGAPCYVSTRTSPGTRLHPSPHPRVETGAGGMTEGSSPTTRRFPLAPWHWASRTARIWNDSR